MSSNVNISIKTSQDLQIYVSTTSAPIDYNSAASLPKSITANTSNYFIIPQSNYYTINIWKINQFQGYPDSWFVINSSLDIVSSHFMNYRPETITGTGTTSTGIIINIESANFWQKYKYWIIAIIIFIILIISGIIVLYFYRRPRAGLLPSTPSQGLETIGSRNINPFSLFS